MVGSNEAHQQRLRVATLTTLLLATAALTQDRPTPQTHPDVCIVVTGLKVDATADPEVLEPAVGAGAEVSLTGPDGPAAVKQVVAWTRGGRTFYTADFSVKFDTDYQLQLKLADGTIIAMQDYRVDSEWTKVPMFTFNSTTGTTSPAAVLRSEVDEATKLGCYVWALWPYTAYQQLGGQQLEP